MPTTPLDSLYTKVAKKILTETLHVKKGESVTVETWDTGLQFARRAVAEARAMGCRATMVFEDESAYVEGVRRAPKDILGTMGKNEYGMLAGTDAYIFIPGQALAVYSKTLKPDELNDSTRYNSSWYDAANKAGLRGARLTFGYVGKDMARLLGKKVDAIAAEQLRAALVDCDEIGRMAKKITPHLADGTSVDLKSDHSSLKFTLKGGLEVEDGVVDADDVKTGNNMTYMPPGLITKEVDPSSANGKVTISGSLTKYGVVPRAELEFKRGMLVSWKSSSDALLQKLLGSSPPEKRRLTILGLGLNPRMKFGNGQDRFVKGSLIVGGFGFSGVVKGGDLTAGGTSILKSGSPA